MTSKKVRQPRKVASTKPKPPPLVGEWTDRHGVVHTLTTPLTGYPVEDARRKEQHEGMIALHRPHPKEPIVQDFQLVGGHVIVLIGPGPAFPWQRVQLKIAKPVFLRGIIL